MGYEAVNESWLPFYFKSKLCELVEYGIIRTHFNTMKRECGKRIGMDIKDKKITKYLKASFVAIAVACIGLFVFMALYLNRETEKMTYEVSRLYMEEIHSQLQQKFETILGLRALQLDALIETAEESEDNWTEEMRRELESSATVKDFMAAGLYRNDGTIEMIYGEDIVIDDELEVNCNCEKQNHMIQLGYDHNGEKVLIIGRIERLAMEDGGTSDALFATLPFSYFNEAMYLDVTETKIISNIIDSEGEYIIKNGGAEKHNTMYERIRSDFKGVAGKTTEDYVIELESALANDTEYCSTYMVKGQTRIIFVSKLISGMDWYVVTFMSIEEINGLLSGLDSSRYTVMIAVIVVIIAMMLCIFLGYYRLSHEQMLELKKAREMADKANRAKSHFLTSMSHDIRTPMNAIMGMSDIAIKHINEPDKALQCLKKVQLSSKHLLGLINDILDMNSIESGNLTIENRDMSLSQFINECVSIMQSQIKAKNQEFEVSVGDIICEHIYSDSVRLEQILINLLSNANKYTYDGGTIQLRVYQEHSNINGEHVRCVFEVEDNGIGMSEEFIDIIFEKFAREDRETVRNINGSGLGMAITKSIVDMMGGNIEVHSQVGQGTLFKVTLDMMKSRLFEEDITLSAKDIEINSNEETSNASELSDRIFLLAEDNDINAEIVEEIMSVYGATIHRAENGRECVEMFQKSEVGYYDMVLMDVHMPIMDGYEATKTIRSLERVDKDLPIIAMTADVFSDNIDSCKASGMNECITKPIDVKECLRVFRRYL